MHEIQRVYNGNCNMYSCGAVICIHMILYVPHGVRSVILEVNSDGLLAVTPPETSTPSQPGIG